MGWQDWAGSAGDNTGGKVWDVIDDAVMYGPDDAWPEDAPINEFLRGVSDVPGNIAGGWADAMTNQPWWAQVTNPLTAGPYVAGKWDEWTSSPYQNPIPDFGSGEPGTGRVPGGFEVVEGGGLGPGSLPPEEAWGEPSLSTLPSFTKPTFDPSGTSAPYDTYLSMLEGMYTTPQTGRIQEMLELGQGEARRRMETADAWEATQSDRLDVSDEALDTALIGMQETFGDRLTTIREGTVERQAETADLRDGLIEAAAGELGEAGAAFLVSATRTGDVLESQRSRNEQHMNDMDGLWSMWSLDRTMRAAGMKQQARRDLADDVLAMKELVHEFDYGLKMANLEALQQAELFSQGQNRQLEQTLAQIGLTRDLAIQSASSEADDDWGRANAWLSNPTTGWAFEGMTPEMVMGMSDAQMQTLYAQAVRESEQIEVAPGVFVDAESWWDATTRNAGQTTDPLMNVGGAMLELPTTVPGVEGLTELLLDQASDPNVQAALDAIAATQGAQGGGLPPIDTSGLEVEDEGGWGTKGWFW